MEHQIFFNELIERVQLLIISNELSEQNNGIRPEVKNITIETSPYDDDPDEQLVKAKTSIGDWLMVWNSVDKEFTTLMKENQK